MKRKALAVGLSVAMALSVTACGGNNAQSGTNNNGEASDLSIPNEEFFPLEETVDVTIAGVRHEDYTKFEDTTVMKKMEEKTNVNVNWLDWPHSIMKEKIGLAFSGDSLPDAFYGSFILSNNEIIKYGSEDYFLDLKPYIENGSMPNFAKVIEKEPQVLKDITTPDGKVYALPAIQLGEGFNLTSDSILINKTWLDKVGKPIPTTTEELYDVLKAFKEAGDLNGNGKADEIPMSFRYSDGNNGCWSMIGWFGTASGTNKNPVVTEDGKLLFAQTTEDYKDAMKYFNRLYSENLLDPEVFTMDRSAYNAKTITEEPTVGVFTTWSKYQVNANIKNGDEYVYLPPLKSDNGNEPQWQTRTFAYNRVPAFLINSESEHIDELIKWADMWYDVDTSIEAMYGGPEYVEKVSDGVYKMLPDASGKETTWSSRSSYCPGNDALASVLPQDFRIEPKKQSLIDKEEANEIYGPFLAKNHYNDNWYTTTEESEKISKYRPDIDSYFDQMAASFVTKGDIDKQWDGYIQSLNKLNMEALLEIYQGIYDRNVK